MRRALLTASLLVCTVCSRTAWGQWGGFGGRGQGMGGRGGYGYLTRIPLKDYAPGLYVIHVEGRSRTSGDERGVGRDIQIRVR